MRFIDFFAGIGGFRRGLELSGHECVGFCEFDKFATASYTSMHLLNEEQRKQLSEIPQRKRQKEILKEEYRNGEWYAKDIRSVNAKDVPRAECWCFGAPCQDFSIAGRRAGLDGDRSSLVREIFRLLEEQEEQNRPEWLIYENVKGMLSSNRGLDYLSILSEMDRLGYDIQWQNINSKWYVPQNRERIYTIGHLRRYGRSKIFPVEGTNGENSISLKLFGCINGRNSQRDRIYDCNGLAPTISTVPGGNTEPKIAIPVLTPDRAEKRQNGRRFKENEEPMFTLTGQDRHGIAIEIKEAMNTHGENRDQGIFVQLSEELTVYAVWHEKYQCYIAIRKLTPRECFILQGWTDDYFEKAAFVSSDSQLYKQAGNGVTVNVVEAIGKKIKEYENN